ncbi:MAG: hypothetical protein COA58_02765 [Bacteroidetes bacterium]|nr:MAG: hypothetical protein COA58_02765 [Bacteroidota bacterium]
MYKHLLFAFYFVAHLATSYGQVSIKDIEFKKKSIDLGSIYVEGGIVTTKYEFTNNGSKVFKILNMDAACGCTKPRASSKVFAPGETGFITVEFNPKGIRGKVDKWIYVRGNFSDAYEIKLNFSAEISSQQNRVAGQYYKGEFGYLLTSKAKLDWGNKYKQDLFQDSISMTNDGYNDIVIKEFVSPTPIIIGTNLPIILKPGETKKIRLTIDVGQVDTIGYYSGILKLKTTDKFYSTKEIAFGVTYYHDYRKLKRKHLKKSPKLILDKTEINMGSMGSGEKKTKSINISNAGKSNLEILRIDTDCSCALLSPEKNTIAPGETITVAVKFDSLYKKGSQNKRIMIYTNDPVNPTKSVFVRAEVR